MTRTLAPFPATRLRRLRRKWRGSWRERERKKE